MDRRIAGALSLVAVVCIPALAGRHIAGAASAVPVPGPLRAGDCLTSLSGVPDQATVSAATAALPTAVAGSCTGLLVGEVVSVSPDTTTDDECARSTVTFLGLPAIRKIAGITWTPGLATGSQELGPDPRQRADGQHWSACAVTGATAQYRGSIRASVTGGLVPNALGLCWPGTVTMDAEPMSCAAPHASQLLATGVVDGTSSASPASLAASCRQYARAVLGGRDPEVGGRLSLRVAAQGIGPQVLLCSVSALGHRRLVGSVLGVGDRPLPLTG